MKFSRPKCRSNPFVRINRIVRNDRKGRKGLIFEYGSRRARSSSRQLITKEVETTDAFPLFRSASADPTNVRALIFPRIAAVFTNAYVSGWLPSIHIQCRATSRCRPSIATSPRGVVQIDVGYGWRNAKRV